MFSPGIVLIIQAFILVISLVLLMSVYLGVKKYFWIFKHNLDMGKQIVDNIELATDLRTALQQNEQLYLCYQPQVDITTGLIWGAESLVRWEHPTKGNIRPDIFIALAESSGLMMELGNFIIKKTCQDLRQLNKLGFNTLNMALNLSAQQFSSGDVAEVIAQAIWTTGIDAKYLELELTESLVMKNPEKALLMLRVLKSMGIKLSIDDFGTGYSSFSYLKKFPVDSLKIDQSFVRAVDKDKDNQVIITTIITMAHNLNLDVVIEGVETQAELNFIKTDTNTAKIQGYLYSRPLAFDDYKALLAKNILQPFTF